VRVDNSRNRRSLAWIYGVVLALVALPTFGVGVYLAATGRGWVMLAAGCASLVVLGVAWPILAALEESRDARRLALSEWSSPMNERLQQVATLMNQISEQQLISDRTKQVAYRTRDRETLRRAIQEEVNNHDWEAAQALASDMERVFGYKQEADRYRKEIDQLKAADLRRQVAEGITVVERHIRAERWPDALAEAHKISQAFPGDEEAHKLPSWVDQRREQHKKQLIDSWHDAINRRDIDGSIEILRKLDLYLTPQEAESMQEPARNLFKEKLNNLRTQLSLAIQDHQWKQALSISEEIIHDFPNARIAQEVRDRMEELKQRVAEAPAQPAEAAPA
jgi:outer membrane protein assembly factor BamD (BamD/ComL family)